MLIAALKRIWSYYTARSKDVPVPQQWMIEVTNRCNLRCPMCSRTCAEKSSLDCVSSSITQSSENHGTLSSFPPYSFTAEGHPRSS